MICATYFRDLCHDPSRWGVSWHASGLTVHGKATGKVYRCSVAGGCASARNRRRTASHRPSTRKRPILTCTGGGGTVAAYDIFQFFSERHPLLTPKNRTGGIIGSRKRSQDAFKYAKQSQVVLRYPVVVERHTPQGLLQQVPLRMLAQHWVTSDQEVDKVFLADQGIIERAIQRLFRRYLPMSMVVQISAASNRSPTPTNDTLPSSKGNKQEKLIERLLRLLLRL